MPRAWTSSAAAGREAREIRRLCNSSGSFSGDGGESLRGPAKVWVEQLAELALTDGISGFMLVVDSGGAGDLRRYAEEVVPEVRELVARQRNR